VIDMVLSVARAACAFPFLMLSLLPAAAQENTNAGVSGEGDFNMYCASCHGEDGKGNGPKAFGLAVKPPDLTTLTARYGSFPRERLVKIIDGREVMPGHGDREMPTWGVWFKAEAAEELGGAEGDEATVKRRIDNLLDYIESLQKVP
jgi:mono/diheme cytochrome c family protein